MDDGLILGRIDLRHDLAFRHRGVEVGEIAVVAVAGPRGHGVDLGRPVVESVLELLADGPRVEEVRAAGVALRSDADAAETGCGETGVLSGVSRHSYNLTRMAS